MNGWNFYLTISCLIKTDLQHIVEKMLGPLNLNYQLQLLKFTTVPEQHAKVLGTQNKWKRLQTPLESHFIRTERSLT
jgi:hypothetical protein